MLRLLAAAALLFAADGALACWRAAGSLAVDGESWRFDSKVEHDREYLFPAGTFILKLTVRPAGKTRATVVYAIHERKDKGLVLVGKGEEADVEAGKPRDIYAKGEPGQPNSIITVKLTDI